MGNINEITWPAYILEKDPLQKKREKWRQGSRFPVNQRSKNEEENSAEKDNVGVVFKQKERQISILIAVYNMSFRHKEQTNQIQQTYLELNSSYKVTLKSYKFYPQIAIDVPVKTQVQINV